MKPVLGEGRGKLLRLPLLVGALGVGFVLTRHWPSDHTLHVVLGDAAPRVDDVRIRYAATTEMAPAEGEWQREVRLHYGAGKAPRVVLHEPRLAAGDYDVEIEVGVASPGGARTVSVRRRVVLDDKAATVDVSAAVRDSLSEPPRP